MAPPVIAFIPGFWEGPTVYSQVKSKLEAQYGYTTTIIPLASTGTEPPNTKTFADDVETIHNSLENLVRDGKDVVLVMHSAGGFIGSQAVQGLDAKGRKMKELSGGVSRLVFLASGLAPEGAKHDSSLPFQEYHGDRMLCKNPQELLFNDVPPAAAEEASKQLRHQPTAAFQDAQITYCGWRDIPSVYLCCEKDALLPPALQRQMAEMAGAKVESCDAGHMVMLSRPDVVVDLVRSVVEGVVGA